MKLLFDHLFSAFLPQFPPPPTILQVRPGGPSTVLPLPYGIHALLPVDYRVRLLVLPVAVPEGLATVGDGRAGLRGHHHRSCHTTIRHKVQ